MSTTQIKASRREAELELDLSGCLYTSGLVWSQRHSPKVMVGRWKPGHPGGPNDMEQS